MLFLCTDSWMSECVQKTSKMDEWKYIIGTRERKEIIQAQRTWELFLNEWLNEFIVVNTFNGIYLWKYI